MRLLGTSATAACSTADGVGGGLCRICFCSHVESFPILHFHTSPPVRVTFMTVLRALLHKGNACNFTVFTVPRGPDDKDTISSSKRANFIYFHSFSHLSFFCHFFPPLFSFSLFCKNDNNGRVYPTYIKCRRRNFKYYYLSFFLSSVSTPAENFIRGQLFCGDAGFSCSGRINLPSHSGDWRKFTYKQHTLCHNSAV